MQTGLETWTLGDLHLALYSTLEAVQLANDNQHLHYRAVKQSTWCQKLGHAVAVATREELVAVSDHVYSQASPTFSRV